MDDGRTKKLLWNGRTEHVLREIIVQIELEMCISFAQLYLRDG